MCPGTAKLAAAGPGSDTVCRKTGGVAVPDIIEPGGALPEPRPKSLGKAVEHVGDKDPDALHRACGGGSNGLSKSSSCSEDRGLAGVWKSWRNMAAPLELCKSSWFALRSAALSARKLANSR